jgi:hypothetical protein
MTYPRLFSVYFDESFELRLLYVSPELITAVRTPTFTGEETVNQCLMSIEYLPSTDLPDRPIYDVML